MLEEDSTVIGLGQLFSIPEYGWWYSTNSTIYMSISIKNICYILYVRRMLPINVSTTPYFQPEGKEVINLVISICKPRFLIDSRSRLCNKPNEPCQSLALSSCLWTHRVSWSLCNCTEFFSVLPPLFKYFHKFIVNYSIYFPISN